MQVAATVCRPDRVEMLLVGDKAVGGAGLPDSKGGERGRISDRVGIVSLCCACVGRSMQGNSRRDSGGFRRAGAARERYGKHRTESSVDGRKKCPATGTSVGGSVGGRKRGDECPRR